MKKKDELASYLNSLVELYEKPIFIENDPISLPHQFTDKQDIEIAGFLTATISWGRRSEIIRKGKILLDIMNGRPLEFANNASEKQLQRLNSFVYRTFQPVDAIYFHHFLYHHYNQYDTLETAFMLDDNQVIEDTIGNRLSNFHEYFMRISRAEARTKKHIANPIKGSAAKRLNMFLRWMVRPNVKGVDFGIWKNIKTSELHLPLDVHVGRIARDWKLLTRKQNDWKAVIELSDNLRQFDREDPAKYDFALFGYAMNQGGK